MASIQDLKKSVNKEYTALMLAQAIDHTKLTFSAGEDKQASIRALCQEALEHQFYAVCVRPEHIKLAKDLIGAHDVKVATVIGFPQEKEDLEMEKKAATIGCFSTESKLAEVKQALADSVDELDLVLNVALFKKEAAGHEFLPENSETMKELQVIKDASQGALIKVIIETDLLSDDEIVKATMACAKTGMFMVKTSTGMLIGGKGASCEAVALIRKTLDEYAPRTQIKASGGIKTKEQAIEFLEMGANRLGTSSGIAIASGSN